MAEQDWYYGFETPPQVLGPNDDLIGRKTVFYGAEELLAAMPAVGDFVEEMITLTSATSSRPVSSTRHSSPIRRSTPSPGA